MWAFATLALATGVAFQMFVDGNQLQREFGTGYRIAELAAALTRTERRTSARRSKAPDFIRRS